MFRDDKHVWRRKRRRNFEKANTCFQSKQCFRFKFPCVYFRGWSMSTREINLTLWRLPLDSVLNLIWIIEFLFILSTLYGDAPNNKILTNRIFFITLCSPLALKTLLQLDVERERCVFLFSLSVPEYHHWSEFKCFTNYATKNEEIISISPGWERERERGDWIRIFKYKSC